MNQNKNELIETLLEEIEELKGRINGIEADITILNHKRGKYKEEIKK